MTSEQEEPSPEPDAWLWKRYILSKTAGVEVASTEKPDEDFAEYLIENGYIEKKEQLEKVPESEEPLFAGSTIRDTIDRDEIQYGWNCPQGGKYFEEFIKSDKGIPRCPSCAKARHEIEKQGQFDHHSKVVRADLLKSALSDSYKSEVFDAE